MQSPSLSRRVTELLIFICLKRICFGQYMDTWTPVHTLPPYSPNDTCSLCDNLGLPLKQNVTLPPELGGTSCNDMHTYIQTATPEDCSRGFDILTSHCCDLTNSIEPYKCTENIRKTILREDNKFVPPKVNYDPLTVDYHVTYEMLEDINIKESTASMFFEIGLKWYDPRLAWNISSDFCRPQILVKASENPETTEIWVPDFNLLNRESGLENWGEVMAHVNYDGTVTWKRCGIASAFCSFQGMSQIPFDTLGCQYMFGSRTNEAYNFVSKIPFSKGIFQQKFKTFQLITKKTEVFYLDDNPGNPIFNFYFSRATRYYLIKIILPTILFTFISFGLFVLDFKLGERLGFGISAVLIIVAQEIITNDHIPISDEDLWISWFVQTSTYFTFAALTESIVLAAIYYKFGNKKRLDTEAQSDSMDGTNEQHGNNPVEQGSDLNAKENMTRARSHQVDTNDEAMLSGPMYENDSVANNENKPTNCWVSCRNRISRVFHNFFASFQQLESCMQPDKIVAKIDRICLLAFPVFYSLFLILAFSWKLNSMDDKNDTWVTGTLVDTEL